MLEENRYQACRDDSMPRKVTKAIKGLRNTKWECISDIIGASVSLIRYVLRRHGASSSQESSD